MDTPRATLSTGARPRTALRIVMQGYLVRGPVGGMAWVTLHYLHGLRRLGHDVWYLEDSSDSPWCCYDPERSVTDADPSCGLRYAAEVFRREELGDQWAYWDAHTGRWLGAGAARAADACRAADLMINLSGIAPMRDWTAQIPCRAFIDTDPGFTQVRHLTDEAARALAGQHTVHFSYAERIGRPDCTIPDDGFAWRPMRQPIVLERWPAAPAPPGAAFSTIMLWNSYQVRSYKGLRLGMKSETFQPYLALPSRTSVPLEIALGGSDAPREQLRSAGWRIVNPLEVSWWPWDYRGYISASAGEFGVAKHGYITTRSGAFSDRTAAFLASGRPVVVNDTGFGEFLPVGEGLLPHATPEEAIDALEAAWREPARHQRAARAIACEHFDSDGVLRRFIEAATSACPAQAW